MISAAEIYVWLGEGKTILQLTLSLGNHIELYRLVLGCSLKLRKSDANHESVNWSVNE